MRNKWSSATLFLIFVSLILINHSSALSSVSRIVISKIDTDANKFPEIIVTGQLLDTKGVPVPGVTKDMITLTENSQDVNFEMREIPAGIRTVLVLDLSKWINNLTSRNGKEIKKVMQDVATRFVDTMQPDDLTEIIVVYKRDPEIAQPFTSDKTKLRDTIINLNWNNDQLSYGIEGIRQAAYELGGMPNDLIKHIVFISSGIIERDLGAKDEISIAKDLSTKNIHVFSLHIPGHDSYQYYEYISNNTSGEFFIYETDKDLDPLFSTITKYRDQYQFTYRSKIGDVLIRTVTLSHKTQAGASDSQTYSVDNSLLSSGSIEIIVNNNEPISIVAESSTTPVPININISGLGNRNITKISFQVNGQQLGDLNQTGMGSFSTTWDIPKSIVAAGNNNLVVDVSALDELGIVHHGSIPLSIRLNLPADPLCRGLGKLPGIGNGLSEACVNSGFGFSTLLNIFFLIIIIALGYVMWSKRDKVREISHNVGDKLKKVADDVTKRLLKQEPKARLYALQGIPDGDRTEFDLYGETNIGRNKEYADLMFNNDKISRLHCTIHEEHAGIWTIEDQESSNGTYVNGQKLKPFEKKELDSNMILEFGEVEYGGIKFRFEILGGKDVDQDFPNEDDNEEAIEVNVRETERIALGGQGELTIATQLDPSDPANQKW